MTWTTRQRSDLGPAAAIRAGADGPAVLLLHGVGLRAEAWAAVADRLAAAARVAAIDLPGHGETPAVSETPTLEAFADVAAAAGEAMGRPVTVVGHSLGALVALTAAVRRPALFAGVVAVCSVHRRTPSAAGAVRARAAALDGKTPADPTATLARWFGPNADAPEARACRAWLTGVDPAGYKAAYTAFAAGDTPADAALARLPIPVVAITGADDPNSTPDMARTLAATVPDGRAIVVDGAAHMLPMTHPAETAAAILPVLRPAHEVPA